MISLLGGEGIAGDIAQVSVSARVVSKSTCLFRSKTAALDLGPLDPANPVDVTANVTVDFRCTGSSPAAAFSITDDDGMHETGPDANRMRHVAVPTEHIPYSLTLTPVSGTVPKNVYRPLTISATVRGTDYQDALVGDYSDTVVVSIDP